MAEIAVWRSRVFVRLLFIPLVAGIYRRRGYCSAWGTWPPVWNWSVMGFGRLPVVRLDNGFGMTKPCSNDVGGKASLRSVTSFSRKLWKRRAQGSNPGLRMTRKNWGCVFVPHQCRGQRWRVPSGIKSFALTALGSGARF